MALNLDTTFKLKAKVEGAKSVDNFKKQLRGLDTSSKMSKVQLGKMNIEINRMARAAGNTTKGLREHIRALTLLRDRTDIGGRAYKRLGNQIDRLKSKLKGLDGQAASTGQKLAGLVATLGVGRGIRRIIGGAATYEAEVTKAAAIEGGGNRNEIQSAVEQTAAIAAGTPTQVAELATVLARAGAKGNDLTASLNGIVLGAEATDTAFAEMGSVVRNNMAVFGLEADKTTALVDILVSAANGANQTVTDLGESLKYAAPVAKTFGLTINDTAAVIGLMANAGIKGSESGTGLRTGLARLQLAASGAKGELLGVSRGSQMLAKGMKALGSDVLDAEGKLKPLDEVLLILKKDLEGMGQDKIGQQTEIMQAIFGREQGSKFLAVLGRSEEEIRGMFETVRNSADVSERTRKAMDSFSLSSKRLGGNFEIITNQIGAAFIVVLKPLVDAFNSLSTAAIKLPTPIKGIAAAAAAAGIAATGLAVAIGSFKALGAVELLKPILVSLKAMAAGFIGASKAALVFLATNPFGWAIIATTVVVGLIAVIVRFRKEIMAFAKKILEIKAIADIKDFVKEKVIAPIISIGTEFRKMVMEKIIAVWNMLPAWLRKWITGTGEKIKTITLNVVEGAKTVTGNVVEGVKDGASNILGAAKTITGIDKKTVDNQNQVISGMIDALEEYRKKASDVAGQVKNAMANALQGMEDALVNFVMTGKLAFGDLARSILADITRIVIRSAIISPILGAFGIKVGSAKGNVFAGGEHLQEYAYGGIVNRRTVFPMKNGMGLMGEAGAEAIMPLKRGSDGKLGVMSQGGGGNVVNVTVNASGTSAQGNTMKANQLGKMIGTAIEAELIKQKRPGGILYE